MITAFDDYCIHQTHEPIAHPVQSDRNFYDRYWFTGLSTADNTIFECGFGVYPNRFVMDGHFSVVLEGVQHSFHSSRRCPIDRSQTAIGPLSIIVEKPMRTVRVRIAENDTGISCDLLFTATTVPTEEPKNLLYQDDIRQVMYNSRFTQFGHWEGWIKVNGKTKEFSQQSTLGTRDKSWGVRPVGEPETGATPKVQAEPRVYWIWNPINFGDVCTQFGSFENADGTPTQLSGCITPTYAPDAIPEFESDLQEMHTVTHKVKWKKGTRRPEAAQVVMKERNGNTHEIQMQYLSHFHMRGIGYQHPEWAHGVWQGEEKISAEKWVMNEVDCLDYSYIHTHTMMQATMGSRKGIGIVETIVLGKHAPSGFVDFLDGAS